MNARDSWLRKQKSKLNKYLELRSGHMSQLEAYYAAWPEEEPFERSRPRTKWYIGWGTGK